MSEYDPKKFDWWKAALAGAEVPYHADRAMQGFYAYKASSKAVPQPVAIWYDGAGELLCKLGEKPHRDAMGMWVSVMRSPISHAVYKSVMAGEPWPHEHKIVTEAGRQDSSLAGHNSNEDADAVFGNILEWTEQLKKTKTAPKTLDEANKLSDIITKLGELCNEGDAIQGRETKPLYDHWKAAIKKRADVINPGRAAIADGKTLVFAFQKAERARREAEAAKLQAEADEAAKKLAEETGVPVEEVPAAVVTAAPVRTGTRGRTLGTVKRTIVVVDDWKAAMAHFGAMDPIPTDIQKAVSDVALALLKQGIPVPGVRLDKEDTIRG